MSTRPAPKVYASRPPCKWFEYPCHRPVEAGRTLCAWHLPQAKAKKLAALPNGNDVAYDYHADPGCDCADCLRQMEATS